ncbi:MAG: CCDC90 family protein [Magnetococcus sp. XQGC-1]
MSTEGGYKSASFVFDSYAYVRRLRDAGMDEQQAAIQAETFMALAEDRLATKQDIAELKRDIAAIDAKVETTKAELQKDIAAIDAKVETVKAELKRDIAILDAKVETTKESLRKEIEVAKNETIKWMVGLALAQLAMMAGILMTLVRVLPGGH